MTQNAAFNNSVDFDLLPVYDDLVKRTNNVKMTDIWVAALSSFIQTLQGYLTQFGVLIPQLTTAQRDAIQLPVGGQMVYNLDTNLPQMFIYTDITVTPPQGQWMTFTLV